jgi:hypothetical protein
MKQLEDFARDHARRVAMEKVAGVSDRVSAFLGNKAAVTGAGFGAIVGGARGAKGSREGEEGYGALTGAALGAVGGGLLGAGARSLYKNVPAGFKGRKEGLEALEKEYMSKNRIRYKPESGQALKDFKSGLKEYRADQLSAMRKAEDLASAGLEGKAARDAIDAVRKSKAYGSAGQFKAGKEQLVGGLIGGGLGVGYGAYQLKDAININKASDQERALDAYVKSASYEAADAVGRMMASVSTDDGDFR